MSNITFLGFLGAAMQGAATVTVGSVITGFVCAKTELKEVMRREANRVLFMVQS
jgi:hypothetical protein